MHFKKNSSSIPSIPADPIESAPAIPNLVIH